MRCVAGGGAFRLPYGRRGELGRRPPAHAGARERRTGKRRWAVAKEGSGDGEPWAPPCWDVTCTLLHRTTCPKWKPPKMYISARLPAGAAQKYDFGKPAALRGLEASLSVLHLDCPIRRAQHAGHNGARSATPVTQLVSLLGKREGRPPVVRGHKSETKALARSRPLPWLEI